MSEQALYRKYRPQNFKEILGQEHVVRTLQGAIAQGLLSHAYLFAGSRGTGKTSVARILAKELGTSAKDIYEIDAASNRGIGDVREIREAVSTYPYDSKYKIYIIDEVHMLTKEAFNALLKTLEEPPPHAIFMLATTEMAKLPETVVSRCQVFEFRKPNQKILREMVLDVAAREDFEIDKPSAELLSIMGDGSYRDALGILQKAMNVSADRKIEIGEMEEITGAPRTSVINGFLENLNAGDARKALESVNAAFAAGADMKIFLKLTLAKLRAVILLKYAPELSDYFKEEFGEDDFEFVKGLSKDGDGKINSSVLAKLLDAYDAVGRSHIPSLPIELALISSADSK